MLSADVVEYSQDDSSGPIETLQDGWKSMLEMLSDPTTGEIIPGCSLELLGSFVLILLLVS